MSKIPELSGAARGRGPLEEWEVNPGNVRGEVAVWEPEHEAHPPFDTTPVQHQEVCIAISANVQTLDVEGKTFRCVKTLATPFMNSGVVDLPPGSEKDIKYTFNNYFVFNVHEGTVLVTVNETQFRISEGGTWFVPRSNYYSIKNDYDIPSRIFFTQACEVQASRPDTAPKRYT